MQFMLEGQEEIGSPQLDAFLAQHTKLLAADAALSADGGQVGLASMLLQDMCKVMQQVPALADTRQVRSSTQPQKPVQTMEQQEVCCQLATGSSAYSGHAVSSTLPALVVLQNVAGLACPARPPGLCARLCSRCCSLS